MKRIWRLILAKNKIRQFKIKEGHKGGTKQTIGTRYSYIFFYPYTLWTPIIWDIGESRIPEPKLSSAPRLSVCGSPGWLDNLLFSVSLGKSNKVHRFSLGREILLFFIQLRQFTYNIVLIGTDKKSVFHWCLPAVTCSVSVLAWVLGILRTILYYGSSFFSQNQDFWDLWTTPL